MSIQHILKIGKKIKTNLGLHFSGFNLKGSNYLSLEPRISARILLTPKWSFKAAYSEMTQYIHLLANSNIGLPTDLWLPVTKNIKPQKSIQYAAGTVYG